MGISLICTKNRLHHEHFVNDNHTLHGFHMEEDTKVAMDFCGKKEQNECLQDMASSLEPAQKNTANDSRLENTSNCDVTSLSEIIVNHASSSANNIADKDGSIEQNFSAVTDFVKLYDTNEQDSDGDEGTFYFESDHLALKGNKDYHDLLKTVVLLEAQRAKAVQDLETLYSIQDEALRDPIAFVEKLQREVDLGIPKPQRIATIPHVAWENYTSSSVGYYKHMTRTKRQIADIKSEPPDSFTSFQTGTSTISSISDQNLIRGRIKDQSKSSTFNQLWTAEEQKRLEELLIQYPPEPVERHRWVKIANALVNRTPIQVASRVQKYFIKLAKAGLPIPGRMPNVANYRSKSQRPHHRLYNRFYQAPSTFMTSYQPPVYMSDDDGESMSMFGGSSEDMEEFRMASMSQFGDAGEEEEEEEISDDESVPVHLRNSEEYQEILRLKKLKRIKVNLDAVNIGSRQHAGYKCDRCGCEPIVGVRFHCIDCPDDTAVDFCEDCVDSSFENGQHISSHRLHPVRLPYTTTFIDRDYTKFTNVKEGYNYLDPNYMPAT